MIDALSTGTFRLYIAGDAPNSRRAVANLTAFCNRYLPNRHHIEIVDVFEHPKRALEEGILLTPLLVIASASPAKRIVGDLTDSSVLLGALGIAAGAS
jgi:circadian clock protein KaiB